MMGAGEYIIANQEESMKKTLFLSNNESEACEEFLRMIKESIH